VRVGVAYRLDGQRTDDLPAHVDVLGRVEPVYEQLPGWRRSTADARRLADLPSEARSYLDRLQSLSGVPIRYVSVGTRRDQIIDVE
jgi:adenylosuccinate synthase